MGETRVDLLHLLEDLRDAYPGSIEETILTEIVANSLDSGASHIRLTADAAHATLTVVDDGAGMRRRDLIKYHDVAATSKTRGQGIGFAGVGIKLGLLISQEVLTESRRGKTYVATRWHLASRHRAPWQWVPPLGLAGARGTAVCLTLQNALSPLVDPGYLEGTLSRHFRPLLDPTFDALLAAHYPRGVRLTVNGHDLERLEWVAPEVAPIEVRLARKRKPSAVGLLIRESAPLPEAQRGVAVSTFGKVIKQGWDWLGITPGTPDRVAGLIEVPALAECLTLNKADFIRTGPRGATYLAYRKAIQQAMAEQLARWGDTRSVSEDARRRVARPLERDLERVLVDLADDFPLLSTLVERHAGGQRRLPVERAGSAIDAHAVIASSVFRTEGRVSEDVGSGASPDAESGRGAPSAPDEAPLPGPADVGSKLASLGGPKRPGRYGLTIQFEERPDDPELGRLVESTVYVNAAHPAYRRAAASRSEGYHTALAVALALAPLATEPAKEHAFVTTFLTRWGEAVATARGRGRQSRP